MRSDSDTRISVRRVLRERERNESSDCGRRASKPECDAISTNDVSPTLPLVYRSIHFSIHYYTL